MSLLQENVLSVKCQRCGNMLPVAVSDIGSTILCECGFGITISPVLSTAEIFSFLTKDPIPSEIIAIDESEGATTAPGIFPLGDVMSSAQIDYGKPKSEQMLSFPDPETLNQDNPFSGKTILFTGFYPEEKEALAGIIEKLGIIQKTTVSAKLDCLVCGRNAGPSKLQKAREAGIPAIPISDFIGQIS